MPVYVYKVLFLSVFSYETHTENNYSNNNNNNNTILNTPLNKELNKDIFRSLGFFTKVRVCVLRKLETKCNGDMRSETVEI